MPRIVSHFVRFWRLLGRFRKQAALFIAITFMAALLNGIGLAMIVPILDTILNDRLDSEFGVWIAQVSGGVGAQTLLISSAALYAFTMVLKEAFFLWRAYFTVRFSMNLRNNWRVQLSESILLAEEGALGEDRRGALIDLLVNQTQNASKFIQFALQILIEAVFVVVMFGIMLSVSWWMTLIVVAVFGSVVSATHLPVRRYASRLGRKSVALALRLSATVSESLTGLREIKVLSREREILDDIGRLNIQQTTLTVREKVLTQLPLTAGNLLIVMLVVFGVIYFATAPAATAQKMLPIAALFILVGQRLSSHITSIIGKWIRVRTLYPALLLVTDSLDSLAPHVAKTGDRKFERLEGEIRFEKVSFCYGDQTRVFNNLNLTFQRGAITAVIGPSGSGKSTIADLLLALRRTNRGRIVVNGKDLKHYDVTSWRRRCAYVSQRPFLFNGTVLENIRLGRQDANEDEVKEAARYAHADGFIGELENGYETPVGEGGAKLSGGQAQRITIARALLRDPDLIVFDEPTSALDAASRDYLRETFHRLVQDKKVVVIMTHDTELINDAHVAYEIRGQTVVSIQSGNAPTAITVP